MVDPLSPYAPTPRRRPHSLRDALAILVLGFAGFTGSLCIIGWLAHRAWLLILLVAS